MSNIICNLSISINRFLLKEKYNYLRKIHLRSYYNVLFFGSDVIGLNCLREIDKIRKNENLIRRLDLVTANSSKNKNAIEKYAETNNMRILHWPNLNINEGEYDIGLIVAFGHLIKADVLKKFPLGMVNVHPSLLPRWRGAAPIIYTLMHGDTVGGVSLMKIKPDIFDVGEIISQQRVPVSDTIKLPELTRQFSDIGAKMLVNCLRNLPRSLENAQPQSNEGVTYAKKINKSISQVRWMEMSAKEVYNLYRAIYGLYPLTTMFKDKQVKLFNAFLVNNDLYSDKPIGTLEYCESTKSIRILCKDKKFINFKSLRIVGRKEISAVDFYNGYIKNISVDVRLCVAC
ncbi:methionyl-tRNA formyltransferase, mitochondrial isoform X1 [Danaus plexippus]|uniref:methionyl-tRNA formyltransferase, mitochondrial isoform X1 n=1 Tax=Danaus plexippus TaxID=13037 RepID=UPI002AB029AF|nr:methionyl-tRNA formyltransferase, mitochondrial isoform X1 [Danaus plexippus]